MSTEAYPQSLASIDLYLWDAILLTSQFPLLPLGAGGGSLCSGFSVFIDLSHCGSIA